MLFAGSNFTIKIKLPYILVARSAGLLLVIILLMYELYCVVAICRIDNSYITCFNNVINNAV